MRRRTLLQRVAVAPVALLAGCSGGDGGADDGSAGTGDGDAGSGSDGGSDATATSTPTPEPTSTPTETETATPMPTPTSTPTATPEPNAVIVENEFGDAIRAGIDGGKVGEGGQFRVTGWVRNAGETSIDSLVVVTRHYADDRYLGSSNDTVRDLLPGDTERFQMGFTREVNNVTRFVVEIRRDL